MIHKKVKFKDKIFWLNECYLGLQLSPLSHFDDKGNLLADPFNDIGFAIIEDGKIMRFGEQIGLKSDLVDYVDS